LVFLRFGFGAFRVVWFFGYGLFFGFSKDDYFDAQALFFSCCVILLQSNVTEKPKKIEQCGIAV
jgi:hypothetical protein